MNIHVIEPSGGLYGSEFCLLDLLEQLGGDHEFVVHLPSGAPFAERLAGLPVRVRAGFPAGADRSRAANLAAYLRLAWAWGRDRPDLVYLNQAGAIRPVALLCGLLRLPLVCQVQTLEDARWVNRHPGLARAARSFICNSRFIGRSLDVPSERKSVFYQGYRFKGLKGFAAGDRPDRAEGLPLRVGLLGRISESKGHYLLVEAARLLMEALSGDAKVLAQRWRFVLIGSAKTEAEDERFLEALEDSGVRDSFELRGYRSDLREELSGLDLMVIPSLAEPLGRILFEAAEAELPVICSDAGGLGEVSRCFGFGVRFSSGDASELASCLEAFRHGWGDEIETMRQRGAEMLARLDLASYARIMESVLGNAARDEVVSVEFYGSDGGESGPPARVRKRLATGEGSSGPAQGRALFVSALPYGRGGGGKYVVGTCLYDALERRGVPGSMIYQWVPVEADSIGVLQSKVLRRILGQRGRFPAYSPRFQEARADRIAMEAAKDSERIYFHGVTPWTRWKADRPYVVSTDVGMMTLLETQGVLHQFSQAEVERLREEEASFMESAEAVCFESDWGRRTTVETYGLSGRNCVTVGRAGLFPVRARDRWTPDSLLLVSVAKHFRQKGGDVIHEAFQRLRREWPELRWHHIGGRPPREVLECEGFVYEGFLDPENHRERERFEKILESAFLLLHPTREDTNPLVITEAACFACPCVSVDRFAIPELVDEGRSGLLIPYPPESEALIAAVRRLLEHQEFYLELRKGALGKARENGGWDEVAERIRRVVGDAGSGAPDGAVVR